MKLRDFFKNGKPSDKKEGTVSKTIDGLLFKVVWDQDDNSGYLRGTIDKNNWQIGTVEMHSDGKGTPYVAQDLGISPKYKRQGLASKLYDYIESLGFNVEPAPPEQQTDAGKAFWKSRQQK